MENFVVVDPINLYTPFSGGDGNLHTQFIRTRKNGIITL